MGTDRDGGRVVIQSEKAKRDEFPTQLQCYCFPVRPSVYPFNSRDQLRSNSSECLLKQSDDTNRFGRISSDEFSIRLRHIGMCREKTRCWCE